MGYEALITQRGALPGLLHKKAYHQVQTEIQEVAHRLRESNKALCRHLKESPNAQGNLVKMQQERLRVQTLLEDTKGELLEQMSFSHLVARVEAARREQEVLAEVKNKEKQASQRATALAAELQAEYLEHEREMKSAMAEIKVLKEPLHRDRAESTVQLNSEEKKWRAQENALQRALQQKELALSQEVATLTRAKKRETVAHERSHDFLSQKLEELTDERTNWATRYDTDHATQQEKLTKLRDDSGVIRQKLNSLRDRKAALEAERAASESDSALGLAVEKARLRQETKMREAILYLQDEGRHYMARLAVKAARGKGKGKKGKKK